MDKGVKGELYARLMCILTRDYLLEEIVPGPSQDQSSMGVHQGCINHP